ncbi:MAG: hypothetical protein JWO31_4306 [Phycisphaerales bacterium]|nr:hypothetical protein [Phycisphaerales bacterium]
MEDPKPTTLPYATVPLRERVGWPGPIDYVLQSAAVATLVGVLVGSVARVGSLKGMYEAFKLKLPSSTEFLLDVDETFARVGGYYWVWVVPAVAPLLLSRLGATARNRFLLLAVIFVAAASAYCSFAVSEPMVSLVQGLTSSSGRR